MEKKLQLTIQFSQNIAYVEMPLVKKLLMRPFQCNY